MKLLNLIRLFKRKPKKNILDSFIKPCVKLTKEEQAEVNKENEEFLKSLNNEVSIKN